MSIKQQIESLYTHTTEAYAAVSAGGGAFTGAKNLANLAGAIDSIPIAPDTPSSLSDIKLMLKAGKIIPAGTEIPDEYDGHSNPLIVAQQLDNTNNSLYGGAEGVILIRKYPEPEIAYSEVGQSNYINSSAKTYLESTYLSNCSDKLRSLIANITIRSYTVNKVSGNKMEQITTKWFLPAECEIMGVTYSTPPNQEGIAWDYWKNKTGLSEPNNSINAGRVERRQSNQGAVKWSTRSTGSSLNNRIVSVTGAIESDSNPNYGRGMVPACFISKD